MFKHIKSGNSSGKGAYHGGDFTVPQHSSPGIKAARTNHKGTNSLPLNSGHGGKVQAGKFHKAPSKLYGK